MGCAVIRVCHLSEIEMAEGVGVINDVHAIGYASTG
jgi:hypothetical protein